MDTGQWGWNASLLRELRGIARATSFGVEIEGWVNAEVEHVLRMMGLETNRGVSNTRQRHFYAARIADGALSYRRVKFRGNDAVPFFARVQLNHRDIIAFDQNRDLILRYELKVFPLYTSNHRWDGPYPQLTIDDIRSIRRDRDAAMILISDEGSYLRMTGNPYQVSAEYTHSIAMDDFIPNVNPNLGGLLPELQQVKDLDGVILHTYGDFEGNQMHVISCYVRPLGVQPVEMTLGYTPYERVDSLGPRGGPVRHYRCTACRTLYNTATEALDHYPECEEADDVETHPSEGRVINIISTGVCGGDCMAPPPDQG
jgi:hypothetical protein